MRRCLEGMIIVKDFSDVPPCFANARDLLSFHSLDTGVIGRQTEAQVSAIEIQEAAQLFCTSSDVLDRVIDVCDPKGRRRIRRELHESDSAFVRHHMLAKIRLSFDDRP